MGYCRRRRDTGCIEGGIIDGGVMRDGSISACTVGLLHYWLYGEGDLMDKWFSIQTMMGWQ